MCYHLSDSLTAEERMDILSTQFSIEMTDKIESEVATMCNLSQGIEDRGIKKGIEIGEEKTFLKAARNLIQQKNWDKIEALKIVGVPEQELSKYIALL